MPCSHFRSARPVFFITLPRMENGEACGRAPCTWMGRRPPSVSDLARRNPLPLLWVFSFSITDGVAGVLHRLPKSPLTRQSLLLWHLRQIRGVRNRAPHAQWQKIPRARSGILKSKEKASPDDSGLARDDDRPKHPGNKPCQAIAPGSSFGDQPGNKSDD
jgi:hypothetical protein